MPSHIPRMYGSQIKKAKKLNIMYKSPIFLSLLSMFLFDETMTMESMIVANASPRNQAMANASCKSPYGSVGNTPTRTMNTRDTT